MTLKLHFLATSADSPSMLLEHPDHAILFDTPDAGQALPVEPDSVFVTRRSTAKLEAAKSLAATFDVPLVGAGKLYSDGLEIEPFECSARTGKKSYEKAYGYLIKSQGVNIGYAPYTGGKFPAELLAADMVILDSEGATHTVEIAKKAGINRILLTRMTDEIRKSQIPGVVFLHDGQSLALVEKAAQYSKEDVDYREPSSEAEGDCAGCRYFVRSDVSKAVWSTAFINDLPDSSFAYVEPGGEQDSEGKTTPRSYRHLPYKDATGRIDPPHVRAALSRANQIKLHTGEKLGEDKAEAIRAKLRTYIEKSEWEEFSKPVEATPNQIRVRVRPVSGFQSDTFRTISIGDKGRGISAVVGRPKGQQTTRVQSYRFDRNKWSRSDAASWVRSHGETPKSAIGTCKIVQGDIDPDFTCDLYEPASLAPLTKKSMFAKIQQAFGSPGGKRALAQKIVKMIPQHSVYVEPYAGGAAVFFAKDKANREVINDLDADIAQAYKDLQTISDAEVRKVQRQDWTVSKARFKRLQKGTATSKTGRLYRFLYMRGSAYGNYTQPSASHEGKVMKVASRLPQIRDRLQDVIITNSDALEIIQKFDGPETFFYLDPPYPTEWQWDKGGHGGSAGSDKWSGRDLYRLFEVLKSVKGKFLLSLEAEVGKGVPKEFNVAKIPVPRQMALGPTGKLRNDPEILVSNYDIHVEKSQPDLGDVHVNKLIKLEEDSELTDDDVIFAKSIDEEKRLVWTVNMIPNAVDGEGHWQSQETIMRTAHEFMMREIPIWSEHKKAVKGIIPVESYVLPMDWDFVDYKGNERHLDAGTWITVLKVENDAEWAKIKNGEYVGTSVRGFARKRPGSPAERKEVGSGA